VKIVEFSDSGERGQKLSVPTITKTEEEWRKQLSPDAFAVTRQAATERPYTGEYLNVHDKGIFRCICCDTALFSSATKFESHTGWPSFWEPIAKENVVEVADNSMGMQRIAVSCRRCEAHLGHVFDDGPRPHRLALLHELGSFAICEGQSPFAPSHLVAHARTHSLENRAPLFSLDRCDLGGCESLIFQTVSVLRGLQAFHRSDEPQPDAVPAARSHPRVNFSPPAAAA
jgi:methionine-R-sulfoxide reductase